MSWIECLGNKSSIASLFSTPPALRDVRIHEITLHQDGPRVTVRIDLNELPDQVPSKWTTKFNKVQVTLMFIEPHQFSLNGWTANNICDVDIDSQSDGVKLSIHGEGFSVNGMFSFVEIANISSYIDEGRY